MESIRVNRGIVINVNDEGGTITVNVEDQQFLDKFYNYIQSLEDISKFMSSKEIKVKPEQEKVQIGIVKTKELMIKLDELFGENCCKKVFGDMIPNFYLIADLFDQLTPIVEKYMTERKKYISSKYSRSRTGDSNE